MTVAISQVFSRRAEPAPTIERSLDEPLLPPGEQPAATADATAADGAARADGGPELFDQLPGRSADPQTGTAGPAILAWWAAQARAAGSRFAALRSGLVARMPAVADELPVGPRRLARRVRSGRKGKVIAQAAVLGVVILGTVGYATLDKSVTLTVDGKSRQLHSFAGSVGSLLQGEKVAINERDLVSPAAGNALHDGDRVVVRYARKLDLTVDGKPTSYWTTELTVDAALKALGIRADGARLSASRSQPIGRDGLALSLSTPKKVSVVADGRTQAVVSTGATVADLLVEQGITVRALDKLSVPVTSPVTSGLVVTLTRIDRRRVTETEKVTFGTTKKSSSSLYKGSTKQISAGRTGSRAAVYDLLLTNGKVTGKTLVSATVITAAVNAVVEVGTKPKPAPTGGGGTVGGNVASLNWPALARCESGGNPRAVNPAGYYGLYQFSLSTWRSVGGSGNPINNSSAEQTYRAQVLYQRAGVGQWPHCGPRLFT